MKTVNCAWKPSCDTEEGITSLSALASASLIQAWGKASLSPTQDSDKWKIIIFHLNLTTAGGWHRHQRHAIMELCVSAKQHRAVNEYFSQLTNEVLAITLISPSFPCQSWNFTGTNHKSSLSSHTAKGCLFKDNLTLPHLLPLCFDLCHFILVGNYSQFSSGWTFRGCRAASCQLHWWWQGACVREIMRNINQKVRQWPTTETVILVSVGTEN